MEDGGSVNIRTDFGDLPAEMGETLRTLLAARVNRDMSREQFLTRLMQLQVLDEDFDRQKNLEELEREAMELVSSFGITPEEESE
jgi:hypothetical protein